MMRPWEGPRVPTVVCALVTRSFIVSTKKEDPIGDSVWDSGVQLERLHCQPQGKKVEKKQKQKTWELQFDMMAARDRCGAALRC